MFALLYRYVLGSHLNKSALGIASHLSGCLFQRETTRGRRREAAASGGAFRSGDATSHTSWGDEVQFSALIEYAPCGHVWDLCAILPLFFSQSHFSKKKKKNSKVVQQKAAWSVLTPPTPTCPHLSSPWKNIQDDWTRMLKMYMQMRATLKHAQVVNKLTRGRNNSV